MFNTGLKKYEYADIDTFTTDLGMKIRKAINKPWRELVKCFIKREIVIEQYPNLDKDKAYIFCANHSFDEDAIAAITSIDRNVYVLNGSTHQLEHNPAMLAVWFNGMVYVNRLDSESRKTSIPKLERVLKNGNSVLIFPEGCYNNSENQLIYHLFAGPYLLSKTLNIDVVPIVTVNDDDEKKIYVRAGTPMPLWQNEKQESLALLRDAMATLIYEIIAEHIPPVKRQVLGSNPRKDYMEVRKSVYACQKWYEDMWDEEFSYYVGHDITTPEQSREYVDNVHIDSQNAAILADVLVRREEDNRYNLKKYLRETFVLSEK